MLLQLIFQFLDFLVPLTTMWLLPLGVCVYRNDYLEDHIGFNSRLIFLLQITLSTTIWHSAPKKKKILTPNQCWLPFDQCKSQASLASSLKEAGYHFLGLSSCDAASCSSFLVYVTGCIQEQEVKDTYLPSSETSGAIQFLGSVCSSNSAHCHFLQSNDGGL